MDDPISDEELVARFPGHPLDLDNAAHYRGRLAARAADQSLRQLRHLAPSAEAGVPGLLVDQRGCD